MRSDTDIPPPDNDAAIDRLRIEVRLLREDVRELKDQEKERAKASRGLMLTSIFAFLIPTIGAIYGYAQLASNVAYSGNHIDALHQRINEQESRIRSLEIKQRMGE